MKNNILISIIIPCYNESENIARGVLTEVEEYLRKQKFTWEVIISDDESKDDSRELIKQFIKNKKEFRLIENLHGGKPFAVRSGLEKAEGEWILFTDMDQATPIDQLDKLLPFFKKADIVIGSRGMTRKNFPLYRKLASFIFLNFRRILLLRDIEDTQCGFKALKREVALKVFPKLQAFRDKSKIHGWRVSAYDVELLFLSENDGNKIIEVPVTWEDTDIAQGKQRNFMKESKEMLKEIIRVKINSLKGYYD